MKQLKRILLAVTMLCVLAAGVFAQDQNKGEQKRPEKEPEKVKVEKPSPPPQNNNRDDGGKKGGGDKRGKP
jgi:hypothetical protein